MRCRRMQGGYVVMSYRTLMALSLGIGLVMVPAGRSGQASAQRAAAASTFVNLDRASSDYRVGPGDLVEIQVIGTEEFTHSLRISNSGDVSIPMLGIMKIADLTLFEVEDAIAESLQQKKLVENPQVLGFVREYQAKPIYVSGAVLNPGEFIMSQDLTVVDAILLAGGLRYNAADEALIHRRVQGFPPGAGAPGIGPGWETIKVDLRPLKEGRFLESASELQRGDVLRVPEMAVNPFYVVGEVFDPRNYFYQPGQVLMASQAISWAKGPVPTAKLSAGMLVRYDAEGKRQELKVDYAAILSGKQADFAIQPHDIIFIPGSRVKTISHGLLMMTDTMVMQQTFRIARRYQLPEAPGAEGR